MIIVTASDHHFVPGLLVLLYSAWLNNRTARLHVIDAGLGTDGTDRVTSLCARHGIDCRILRADADALARLPNPGHLTPATYARLFLPDLLPEHDRAIYIDSDALVIADLEPLWRMELGDELVAGVVDSEMRPVSLGKFGVPAGQYINAGVLLMNLERWREERIGPRCVDQLMRHPELEHADQTAINIVAKGRIRHLDRCFNFFAAKPLPKEGMDPRILHFAGPDKPWIRAGLLLGAIFDAYGRAAGAGISAPERAWSARSLRKTALGLLTLRPKYWRPLLRRAERRPFVRRQVRALATKATAAGLSGSA
ncbi:glycosyltransferase family 8 protein [Kaistia adipata]|uniref:glycosyltransferase family 8 protein n=1 Tax=Kaistia adipata TaxID=166954 RepID=UPI000424067F|nr:glycosyltransferase family 8 protein [Kaistia adipata]